MVNSRNAITTSVHSLFLKTDIADGVVQNASFHACIEKWFPCTDLLLRERTATNLQLISDLCDLTVPGSALGYLNLDDGFVGLSGTVSSLIGVWSQWKKTA